jgi:hypothetical protein
VKIRVASSGKQLHADDLGDSRLSTRSQKDDPWSRFIFERVATAAANAGGGDGSAGTMRIRVDADLRMLAATPELVSNATQDGGPAERFSLEPADRGYRIRSAATQMYWAVGRTAAGFVSATAADAASGTVFTIAPVPGGACKADADCNYNGVCAVNADANANANANGPRQRPTHDHDPHLHSTIHLDLCQCLECYLRILVHHLVHPIPTCSSLPLTRCVMYTFGLSTTPPR